MWRHRRSLGYAHGREPITIIPSLKSLISWSPYPYRLDDEQLADEVSGKLARIAAEPFTDNLRALAITSGAE
jgi:hypothetical protein